MSTSQTVCRWALVVAIVMLTHSAKAQDSLTVFKAVELALARNPELNAMAAEVRAAEARVDGASLVLQANPELGGAIGPRFGAGSDQLDYEAELSQQLEIFGQRAARIDVARTGRAGATARLRARRAEVAADVRQAFGRALAAKRLLAITRENLELARQTAKAAETRLELGDGSRIEVNTARVEVGRAAREVSLARRGHAAACADLRLLLALDPTVELRLDGDLTTPFVTPAEGDGLEQRALRNRAERVATEQDVEGARAEQTFADRDWLPRPRIGVRYEKDEGDDVVLGTLSFDLPVFNQNQAARGVAAAQLSQAELALAATQRRIRQEVLLAVSRLATAREAAQAFEGQVVDAMEENLKLINTAYEAGKIDLFELLLIRRDTLEARRGHIEALEELRAAEAALAKAMGQEQ